MSDIRHRPLGPAGDDDDFTDNESAPLTTDIYGGRWVSIFELKTNRILFVEDINFHFKFSTD